MKESKEPSVAKEAVEIFLGIAAGIVGIAFLMVLGVSCIMVGQTVVTWLWKALGN